MRKPTRRDPSYTPREEIALENAEYIILRVRINGEWKEKREPAPPGASLLHVLEGIQAQLRHSPDIRGVCLYVGGSDPISGEMMKASVPHEWIPENVKRYLK